MKRDLRNTFFGSTNSADKIYLDPIRFKQIKTTSTAHLSTLYSRSLERKKSKHFVFYKYFCLLLGVDIEIFWTADWEGNL